LEWNVTQKSSISSDQSSDAIPQGKATNERKLIGYRFTLGRWQIEVRDAFRFVVAFLAEWRQND